MTGPRRAARSSVREHLGGTAEAIVVRLWFSSSPVALPVLFRLWRGKGTASQVELAAEMLEKLAGTFPGRAGSRDRGCRLPRRAPGDRGHHVDDPAAGQRGAVRAQAAADDRQAGPPAGVRDRPGHLRRRKPRRPRTGRMPSSTSTGKATTVQIARRRCTVARQLQDRSGPRRPGPRPRLRQGLRPGDIHPRRRTPAPPPSPNATPGGGPIEPSNAAGKQLMGVGDACNRAENAVERTVPFGFLVQSLLTLLVRPMGRRPRRHSGRRRRLCPWYRTKTGPSPADMLARLRRDFPEAPISAIRPGPGQPVIKSATRDAWTWDTTAA